MIQRYTIDYIDTTGNTYPGSDQEVTRDFDFIRNDERRLVRIEAFERAKTRAAESGFVQQVSQIDGPLYGGKQWLIQHTDTKIPTPPTPKVGGKPVS